MNFSQYKSKILELSIYDHVHIIKLAQSLNKSRESICKQKVKIAVIGSYSLQYFVMVLKLLLLKYNVYADIYEGEYNGIDMDVFDKESQLYKFEPEIVIILPDYRDIRNMPELFSEKETIDAFVHSQINYYQKVWNQISSILHCYIFQTNMVLPIERELGNLEANAYYSKSNIYHLLNIALIENKFSNVTIIDLEYIASVEGKSRWFDYAKYFTSKLGYSLKYIGVVCDVFAQQVSNLYGYVKKCLILDLDNTLWGGVVAEQGGQGIIIDPNDAIGEAYRFFQQYILNLKKRGIILAVISKNDYEVAKEPFIMNENMILKYDDFSCFIANWEDKASNIDAVAKKLNISTDSFVFFDDNPAEREIVKMYHPEVLVIDVPENVAEYVIALEKAHPFEWLNLTEEDIARGNSYKSNVERRELRIQYDDYQEYLAVLCMKGKVDYLKTENIERFTQLINKSNQFNTRTKRYSSENIMEMLSNNGYCLLTVTLEDCFSKFGIISCVILKKTGQECFIDTWVMSCRVLKRDVEYLTFNKILEIAIQWGCESIVGEYIATPKNSLVKELFPQLGFHILENGNGEGTKYVYNVNAGLIRDTVIKEIE